jgi:hypothetical protein
MERVIIIIDATIILSQAYPEVSMKEGISLHYHNRRGCQHVASFVPSDVIFLYISLRGCFLHLNNSSVLPCPKADSKDASHFCAGKTMNVLHWPNDQCIFSCLQ